MTTRHLMAHWRRRAKRAQRKLARLRGRDEGGLRRLRRISRALTALEAAHVGNERAWERGNEQLQTALAAAVDAALATPSTTRLRAAQVVEWLRARQEER